MNEYFDANRRRWDELVPIHERSDFYRAHDFRNGAVVLNNLERGEVGDVTGKTLLHLQCHFGLDTLSWARLGATVTGVDFAPAAVESARRLSAETGVPGTFIESDIYSLPGKLNGQFDIVFTSYGALIWLPDIARWARVAARYVRPGGFLYLAEMHPFTGIFENEPWVTDFQIAYPYFTPEEPLTFDEGGSYADPDARTEHTLTHEWPHPVGAVVTALIDAGLRIEFLHEFPFTVYQAFPFMKRSGDGYWRLPEHAESVPLLYSIKATKPA